MKNAKCRVIFFGTPDFVVPVLRTLYNSFSVVSVVTTPDTIQGRKKILTPSPVKIFAIEHDIPVFQPEKLSHDVLDDLPEADLYVVAAYGKIIPQKILDKPRHGAINIHPSLLPKYRGPSPIQSMLLAGDKETGITFMQMDSQMDHGAIITQTTQVVTGEDTFASLHTSMFQEAAALLPEIITQYLSGALVPTPQNESDATYCQMITRENGYFDSENPPAPRILDQMIRAFYPWPTAWTRIHTNDGEKILKVLPTGKVQLEGTKPMTVKDLLNGHPELREKIGKFLVLSS